MVNFAVAVAAGTAVTVVGFFATGTTEIWCGSGCLTSDPSCNDRFKMLCEEHVADKTSEHWRS